VFVRSLSWGLVLASLAAVQQPPARDPRPVWPSGTAVLAGRVVTADEQAAPVRRANVVITRSDVEVVRSVMTDDAGRFVASGLPAGRYTVGATRAGSLRASYGAARPGRPGTAVELAAGQRMTDLVLRMARGGVITGIVTDDTGRPVPDILMRVLQFRFVNGERTLVPATGSTGIGETTDDRGEYRLYGLAPGDYVVAAVPNDEAGGTTRVAGGGTVGYVPVYSPGTPMASEAATVSVKAGEETPGVNLLLQPVRTATIDGIVIGPDSIRPQDVQLTLTPRSPAPIEAGSTPLASLVASLRLRSSLGPDRTFSFVGVVPGRYTVTARVVERSPLQAGQTYASVVVGVSSMWGMADVVVDGTDVPGVTLALQPAMTVTGRVQFDAAIGAGAPPADAKRVRVSLRAADLADFALSIPSVPANASGAFTIAGVLPGTYRISAAYDGDLAADWHLKTAVAKGKDASDFPVQIQPEEQLSGVVVTMTTATQRLTGLLQDGSGAPAPGLTVVVFPADRAYWSIPRRIRTARSGRDGRYSMADLPAGDYRMAAVTDLGPGESGDPAFLDTLVATAIAFSLRDGEHRVQDLRVGRLQGRDTRNTQASALGAARPSGTCATKPVPDRSHGIVRPVPSSVTVAPAAGARPATVRFRGSVVSPAPGR
jgi:hypothetical protein